MFEGIKFHNKQVEFLTDPSPFRLFLAGYGTGKTFINVIETFIQLQFEHPGYRGLVIAPTYKHLQQGWLETWKKLIPRDYWDLNVQSQVITLTNGSKIFLRYVDDGSNLAGVNCAFVSIDEAALINDPEAFKAAIARLREGKPGKPLRCILTSTPNGFNWLPQEFGMGPDTISWHGDNGKWTSEDNMFTTIRAATSDNPHLPQQYLDTLQQNSKEWVEQYFYAKYTKSEGLVFKDFDPALHVISKTPENFKDIGMGVDWGFTHNGVALVAGLTARGSIVIISEECHKGLVYDHNGWFKVFERLYEKYSMQWAVCDPSEPAYITAVRNHFKNKKLVYEADNRRRESIRVLQSLFAQNKLFISSECKTLIKELQNWKFKEGTEDGVKVDDDTIDALRYVVMHFAENVKFNNLLR